MSIFAQPCDGYRGRRGRRLAGLRALAAAHAALARMHPAERLALAGVASAVLHNLLFFMFAAAFKSANPDLFAAREPPLEVVLLHSAAARVPVQAEVLAQVNSDGGGQERTAHRARAPLATVASSSPSPNPERLTTPAPQREPAADAPLTQTRANYAVPVTEPVPAVTPTRPEAPQDLLARSLQHVRNLGQIEADLHPYQQRPRRMYVGARAAEYVFARYIEDWRLKVERVGNLNYPEAARRQKMYGSLMLSVEINADGELLKAEVERSSGSRVLDAAAVKIVEMAAPFPPFNPKMREKAEVLSLSRVWTFTREDRLSAQ